MLFATFKFPIGDKDGEYTPDRKFAYWKEAECLVCGTRTRLNDADMFFDGIATPLCSEKCMEKYWERITRKSG